MPNLWQVHLMSSLISAHNMFVQPVALIVLHTISKMSWQQRSLIAETSLLPEVTRWDVVVEVERQTKDNSYQSPGEIEPASGTSGAEGVHAVEFSPIEDFYQSPANFCSGPW